MKKEKRVFLCAGALMLLAGVIFGCLHQWIAAALLGAGVLGCLAADLCSKDRKDD